MLQIDGNTCVVAREVDSGTETLKLTLPAVVSVDLRLNTPRYASLPNIMKAKQKPLAITPLEAMALPLKEHYSSLSIKAPEARKSGIKVASVEELIEKLKHDAKVFIKEEIAMNTCINVEHDNQHKHALSHVLTAAQMLVFC